MTSLVRTVDLLIVVGCLFLAFSVICCFSQICVFVKVGASEHLKALFFKGLELLRL